MKLINPVKLAKWIFAVIGAVIFANGISVFFTSNINIGNFLTVLSGAAIMLLAFFYGRLAKWFKFILILCIAVVVCMSSFLIAYGKNDNVTYKEDAVIVLGAALHKSTPSLSLKRRLDAAVDYHSKKPDSIIVVSGGKGSQESITEADAMEQYLIEKGVPQEKILKESDSTGTYENFKFSKQILDSSLGKDYTAAFITNEFHIFRSVKYAKAAGFTNITHCHGNTPASYIITGTLRECLAVVYSLFKK